MRHLAATLAIILTACASEPERPVRPSKPPAPEPEREPIVIRNTYKETQAYRDRERAEEEAYRKAAPEVAAKEQSLREPKVTRLNHDPYQPPEMPEGVDGIAWMRAHPLEYSEWQRSHPKPKDPPIWPPYKATNIDDLREELGLMPEQIRDAATIRKISEDNDGLERASLMNAIRDSKGNLSTYDAACQAYEKAMVRLIAKERARAQEVEDEKAKAVLYDRIWNTCLANGTFR